MSDIPGDAGTAVTLAIGGSVTSAIETPGDRDWVRVNLVAGTTYRFALDGTGTGALGDPFLSLRDGGGALVASDDDSGPGLNALLSFTARASGTHFLDVRAYAPTQTGTYTLSASAGPVAPGPIAPGRPTFSNDQVATYLTDGYWASVGERSHRWGTNTITYDVTGLTAEGAALARTAFEAWAGVANLAFVERAGGAMIRLDDNAANAYETDSHAGGVLTSAFINIGTDWLRQYGTDLLSYSYQTYVHEIGHALGLGHAGPYNGTANYGTDNAYANDSWQATVMSYFDQDENPTVNASFAYVLSPQVADIIAVQRHYGASGARGGDTTYGFGTNAGAVFDAARFGSDAAAPVNHSYTIHDAGGTDTLDYSGYARNGFITLSAETPFHVGGAVGNVAIARGTVIENAIGGGGSDLILGNAVANRLVGGGGGDTIEGGGGRDTIEGGDGFDVAVVRGLDGGGFDVVARGGVVYTLDRANRSFDVNLGVERIAQSGGGSMDVGAADGFDALAYAASYDDLSRAFGTNADAAFSHYLGDGFAERRETTFDAGQYLRNYGDLRAAFGGDAGAATAHFLADGVREHRLAEDPLDYVASFRDLILTFRGQSQAGLAVSGLGHYGAGGWAEGRRGLIGFDAEQYAANYGDVAAAFRGDGDAATTHYINNGYAEARLDADPLAYVASFADLVVAFRGGDAAALRAAGLTHFSGYGFREGRRAGVDFDVEGYLANYADLRVAFLAGGTAPGEGLYDEAAATLHFIRNGYAEGRTDAVF